MASGRAKIAIGQGVSVWVLDAPGGFGDAKAHSHHAIQLTFSLSGELKLMGGALDVCAPIIGVAADAPHRLEAHGLLVIVFVEPESRAGQRLSSRFFRTDQLIGLDPELLSSVSCLTETFIKPFSHDELLKIGRNAVERLVPPEAELTADPRVLRILEYTSEHLDEPLTLAGASAGVHLSPSRLRHLFVEQTGLPFKTYVLWLRLVRAVQVYSEDKVSLTEAAHAAGFADSAHFSRAFKRTFGAPATTLERI